MTISLRQRFTVDVVELAWDRWGSDDGVPLVLCHGFTGSSMDFGQAIPLLCEQRGVLAFDHRGHGLSTNTGDAAGYSLNRLAEDMAAWLAAVVPGPVDLLGHSMGGRLALQTTLDHPELVRSLVLMDTSAGAFAPDDATAELMSGFLTQFDPARGLPSHVSEGVGPEQELAIATLDPAFIEARRERNAQTDPWAFRTLGLQLSQLDLASFAPRLGELDLPVTVIAGSLDHPLVDLAPGIAAAVAGAALMVIDGAFHSPQLTHPDAWLAAIAAHLARADAVPV